MYIFSYFPTYLYVINCDFSIYLHLFAKLIYNYLIMTKPKSIVNFLLKMFNFSMCTI